MLADVRPFRICYGYLVRSRDLPRTIVFSLFGNRVHLELLGIAASALIL